MFAVLSDTHSRDGSRLAGRAEAAVEDADRVVHAGDFVTTGALDAFESRAADLVAVHGNVDEPAVAERLPASRTVELAGVRVAVAHGHEHRDATALALFGRERDADLVVFGHSHVPGVERAGDVTLLNPGSHADPRGNPAAHAELEPLAAGAADGDSTADDPAAGGSTDAESAAGGLRGRIVERDGTVLEEFVVESG